MTYSAISARENFKIRLVVDRVACFPPNLCSWRSPFCSPFYGSPTEDHERKRIRFGTNSADDLSNALACNCLNRGLLHFRNTSTKVARCPRQRRTITAVVPMNSAQEKNRPINTRRFPRYEIDAELNVTTSEFRKREVMRGRSLNISQAGMGGLFVSGWDLGTAVNLEFSVPLASKPLSVGAVVRSCSDHRYGFEFVDLSPGQRAIISRTCRTLALLE
jgi:PilZ domain